MYRILVGIVCLLMAFSYESTGQTSKTKKKSSKKSTTKQATKPAVTPFEEIKASDIDKPDIHVRPKALPATGFEFPSYTESTLQNGLHVYVIENHEQPVVTFSIVLRGGEAYDPVGKEGVAAITGDMLGKGTAKRTAKQIADALDGVGAYISVASTGETMTITASCIKRHMPILLGILGDELREPTFNEEELEKLKQQYQSSVKSRRSRALEIAQALSRKVVYGMDNPLARRTSEKTIGSVTREDVVAFHSAYIRPNSASIAIVGDISEKESKDLLRKYFEPWEKGTRPVTEFPPMKTEPAGVYFVPRKGSVQSSIIVCAAGPAVRDRDYEAASVMTDYIGGGFGSMFFNTLRETYSYTYSPFSLLTRGRRYNRIACGAEVRNTVTDSALTVMFREIRKLAAEGPDDAALSRRIASEVGQYRIAFERASTVAAVLQNSWINDVPIDEVINYTSRLEQLGAGDIQEAASRYLNMFNLRVVVVGSPDIRNVLEQFGPVKDFTLDLEPAKLDPLEQVDMTVEQLVAKHVEALGGKPAVDAIKSVSFKGIAMMVMQGREYAGSFERTLLAPNKEVSRFDLGMMKQSQWVDGRNAWVSISDGPAGEQSAEESAQLIREARIFPFITLVEDGYKVVVKGKRNGQIMVEATNPSGRQDRFYLDESSMLVVRLEKDEQTPQGVLTTIDKYDAYTSVGGVKFPTITMSQNSIYSLTLRNTVTVNEVLSDAMFTPPTK